MKSKRLEGLKAEAASQEEEEEEEVEWWIDGWMDGWMMDGRSGQRTNERRTNDERRLLPSFNSVITQFQSCNYTAFA